MCYKNVFSPENKEPHHSVCSISITVWDGIKFSHGIIMILPNQFDIGYMNVIVQAL